MFLWLCDFLQIKLYIAIFFLLMLFRGLNSYTLWRDIHETKINDSAVYICSYRWQLLRVQAPGTKKEARPSQRYVSRINNRLLYGVDTRWRH